MVNKKDMIIFSHLRANARETLTRISKKTSIPISTIYDRIKMYEGSVITKHTTLIDFAQLGFNTRANIMIRSDKASKQQLTDFLINNEHTNSVYKINNGFDLLVDAVFRNIKDLEDFIEMVEGKFDVRDKQVYFIIDDLKRETFLSSPEMVDLVN
ncbi:MAG: Lrp/AsnC family transcriptional regulator [bacterium]|nr:Lrp/AsnC family transcriptional regulator [bacterium]